MSKSPTKITFIWHMHQPCCKYPGKEYYSLPWVRLHGIKDYYGMAKMVDKFEATKVVFNYSGILLEQLLDYVYNGAKDQYGELSLKNAADLTVKEKEFIIDRFFSINFEKFIRHNPRYLQLYNKKLSPKLSFSFQDICDLQAIFNLCWFHPYSIKEDKYLRSLIGKKKNYTQEDKEYIINAQYDILKKIFPLYQKLIAEKKIEVTLSPHQHPIMPLVYDTDIIKDTPYLKRPQERFYAPQDCTWHINKARKLYDKAFGGQAKGSWPPEGGVSEAVASLYAQEGFKWIAADETILFKSLVTDYVPYDMIKNQRHMVYSPYNFRGVNVLFRDRNFADLISFTYQGWEDPVFAATDLLEHFKKTHMYMKELLRERVITIAMDGDNAWEYYQNNGVEFLETIYTLIEKSTFLQTDVPSHYLPHVRSKNLDRLASGSWVNGDFGVWIGNVKNNNYWDILYRIKGVVDKANVSPSVMEKVKEYLHLIEGSDWYWWNTFEDHVGEFKNIFFAYVAEIFRLLDKKLPSYAKPHQ